jgi:hypothetical protein
MRRKQPQIRQLRHKELPPTLELAEVVAEVDPSDLNKILIAKHISRCLRAPFLFVLKLNKFTIKLNEKILKINRETFQGWKILRVILSTS